MRAMTKHNVGTGINNPVRKLPDIAAVFTVKNLFCSWDMLMVSSFCSTMKRNDDDIYFLFQLRNDFFCPGYVAQIAGTTIGRKSTKPIFHTIPFEDGCFICAHQTRICNTGLCQSAHP